MDFATLALHNAVFLLLFQTKATMDELGHHNGVVPQLSSPCRWLEYSLSSNGLGKRQIHRFGRCCHGHTTDEHGRVVACSLAEVGIDCRSVRRFATRPLVGLLMKSPQSGHLQRSELNSPYGI